MGSVTTYMCSARLQRYGEPDRGGELARPHAGRQHHPASLEVPLGRLHGDDAAALLDQPGDRASLDDPRPAHARAPRQGLGGVGGVGLTVRGHVDGADQVVGADDRVEAGDPGGLDQAHLDAEGVGHAGLALQLMEARLGLGHGDGADLAEAGRQPRLLLESRIELDGIGREPRQIARGPELAHQAGGMPGRAAGQPVALQQHHVLDPAPGQVIGDGDPDDAAADDDGVRAGRKPAGHGPFRPPGEARRAARPAPPSPAGSRRTRPRNPTGRRRRGSP